ncbi:hypothetical protein DMENIID0001_156420 [Sergentomyia squamirostris]
MVIQDISPLSHSVCDLVSRWKITRITQFPQLRPPSTVVASLRQQFTNLLIPTQSGSIGARFYPHVVILHPHKIGTSLHWERKRRTLYLYGFVGSLEVHGDYEDLSGENVQLSVQK